MGASRSELENHHILNLLQVLIEELESLKAKEIVDFISTDPENAIEKGVKVHHRCSTPSVTKDMLQNNSRLKKRLGRIFPPTPECAPLLDTGIFLESVFRNATDANDGCSYEIGIFEKFDV